MTSTSAIKSASFALRDFLRGKPVGYSFTVDSLREDFMTDPSTSHQVSRGAVSGFVSKAYARKAFLRHREVGNVRRYTLCDASLIFAQNRRSQGSKAGVKKPHHVMPDSDAPQPAAKPSLPGLGAAPLRPIPQPPPPVMPPKLHVPADIAARLTRDTMLGAIREIVDAHLAAFEANRPAAEFPDSITCVARHGRDLLPHLSTDEILAELKRRADHG